MDIANIQPSERVIEIHHPADENELMGIRVTLISITDPRMKKIKRKIQDAKLKLDAKGKSFKSEEIEENANEMLFSAMTGWDWYGKDATFKGKKPEFNRASVFDVLTTVEWFADQLTEAITDEKSFFTASKTS
jgi:hypothetical protein